MTATRTGATLCRRIKSRRRPMHCGKRVARIVTLGVLLELPGLKSKRLKTGVNIDCSARGNAARVYIISRLRVYRGWLHLDCLLACSSESFFRAVWSQNLRDFLTHVADFLSPILQVTHAFRRGR